MPLEDKVGRMVRTPLPEKLSMDTVVIAPPLVSSLRMSCWTVKGASKDVARTPEIPVAACEEKITVVGDPGTTAETEEPAASVDQLLWPPNGDVSVPHLPSERPPCQ